ncbi:CRISPR-associated endonuclease Csn1 [Tenacibaculum sp. MAR_2009_124]|uniref:type II CRISPR RNA-guided endonuclease Cas9 n=1 Tax=Tenacibaculum sp. MAR_2009_124 TaxID=1250059 RepID=UPI00089B0E8D|nr:type II CRISPR RNA-guided endonuclease Cas9 [Tenacibaculum sp. MAR_2009_124]SEC29366.1 CRISPR-associated endonuclease Csn1 [Tenacibaculum sp. MAR_2009_124]
MSKKVLGISLGTNSIGWALVKECERDSSEIIKLGVRVNPLTVDEKINFEKGKPQKTNADRIQKRSSRRNLQRFALRRKALIDILLKNKIISKETVLTEHGKSTTHQTLALRAKAARKKISLEELARVLLNINKKRGYKSSRKIKKEEEGNAIDTINVAKELQEMKLTPGEYSLQLLNAGKKMIPDFYRSDLFQEFNSIWEFQKQFHSELLKDDLYADLQGKSKNQTWTICQKPFDIKGLKIKVRGVELKKKLYKLRVRALSRKLNLEQLAIVFQEINGDIVKSSRYLGAISDRSKRLYFNNQTVGENLYQQIKNNRHTSIKNQVFYRSDYLDEFEQIWRTQSAFHPELTNNLKEVLRDVIIFYQRRLKSQKGLLSFCPFESREQNYVNKVLGKIKKRIIGRKVIAKSSPLFQEFKIWQNINNLEFENIESKEKLICKELDKEVRNHLFQTLNIRGDLKPYALLKIVGKYFQMGKLGNWKCNYDIIEGNTTNQALFAVYRNILENEGYLCEWEKKSVFEIKEEATTVFRALGIVTDILDFNANYEGSEFDKQSGYHLWHLLYATEEDSNISVEDTEVYGNTSVGLKKKLIQKFGFAIEQAKMIANISFPLEYGNLSSKAIRKIIPYLQDGYGYSKACVLAGYHNSDNSPTEKKEDRVLVDKLEPLPKNELRNPVVNKILNQMINLVNQIIIEYGKPNELRIELSRELKKNAKERALLVKNITEATKRNQKIKSIIRRDFGIPDPTRGDVIRFKLYQELEPNGYREVFTNRKIDYEDLFTSKINIEHIIPKSALFDDSYSNKTITYRELNFKKANRTAFDFVSHDYKSKLDTYEKRVDNLYDSKGVSGISKAKRNKLLLSQHNLPENFIEKDVRTSQYITKKAINILEAAIENVVPTGSRITDKLKRDWDLVNVIKDLNISKYRDLELTSFEERLDKGKEELIKVEVIKDWNRRNDHRHLALDALTVAFTTENHIHYINSLNLRLNSEGKESDMFREIEEELKGKSLFIPPLPNFRSTTKKCIEDVLVSFKNKNKVVTKNINEVKTGSGVLKKQQLTPRGQLHKETVYGYVKKVEQSPTKISKNFKVEQTELIINEEQKEAVHCHLSKYKNNPSIAFAAKTLRSTPILYKKKPLKEVYCYEHLYTIRKEITPENFRNQKCINKVVDLKIRALLLERLEAYKNNAKEAFSNLEEYPIWLDQERGISIKRVTITGVTNAEPLHCKKDHLGRAILNEDGNQIPADFISTGNNHHIAIYADKEGNLEEKVISFYEAVHRANKGLSVVDKKFNQNLGWKFLFSLKQNEMFVFSDENFNPKEIDLLDEENAKTIGKYLYRVQKIRTKDYFFRHHIEATVDDNPKTKGITWKRVGLLGLKNVVKVRMNHSGKIVQIGEYN